MSWWSNDDPRRTAALIAVVLAATAVVGLGAGYLMGLASGGGTVETATTPGRSQPSSTPPPSPSPSTQKRAASQIEQGLRSDVGYLLASRKESDGTHVTFDRVVFKTGQAAQDYAKRYHTKKPGPDGVLLINENPMTRDLVLSPHVEVLGTKALAGSQDARPVPLSSLLDAVRANGRHLLLDLTYDRLGYVSRIAEHDLS